MSLLSRDLVGLTQKGVITFKGSGRGWYKLEIIMNEIKGFERYLKLMADFAPTFLKDDVDKKLKDINYYAEQTGGEHLLFKGFTEILSSLDNLRLIEKFIDCHPPSMDGINYSNYLTYHIHNYLQEMYIMKDRLDKYMEFINESYQEKIGKDLLESFKKNYKKIIKSTLNNITAFKTGVRSKHVHYERFMDEELKWLSSTTFLSDFHEEFKIVSQDAYDVAKDKWHKTIFNNNEELGKLLDMYFDTIYVIITLDNQVILPTKEINAK